MAYSEKNFQLEFKKNNKVIGVFELKICKGKSLPFSRLEDKGKDGRKISQEEVLKLINSDIGFYYKIPDFGGYFSGRKNFDCFNLANCPAFIVIMFYTPRTKKNVYYVSIKKWFKMKDNTDRRSVTEEMLTDYCYKKESYLKKDLTSKI